MWYIFKVLLLVNVAYVQIEAQGSGYPVYTSDALDGDSGSGNGEIVDVLSTTCTPEFAREQGHTMCMQDSWKVSRSGVSAQDKKTIVDFHNAKRGSARPPATDLTALIWDDNVAAVAEKWARQCKLDHDKNRNIPSYGMHIGQNVAAGQWTWEDALNDWHNEVLDYQYGKPVESYLGPGGFSKIGHYTQIVQNTTQRIGCGFADCLSSRYGRYYVCNYAKGQSDAVFPYTSGPQCSACPNSCKKGVCDCRGKLCLNGGKLDINTCTCSCPDIYNGDDCSQLECPKSDPRFCHPSRGLKLSDCKRYSNMPALCPYMCGVCGKNAPNTQTSQTNGGPMALTSQVSNKPPSRYISQNNQCVFTGEKPSQAECRRLGVQGQDMPVCRQHSCGSCNSKNDVPHMCPVLCGLCDAPCGGKECLHDGYLSADTCTCSCPAPYTGDHCEIRYVYGGLNNVQNQAPSSSPAPPTPSPVRASQPPAFVSPFGCPYWNIRPSAEECRRYGIDGQDRSTCMSKGGQFGCLSCQMNPKVKFDHCPVMCGLCDAPCDGKICMNGGSLNVTSCTCNCDAPFSGDLCDILVCPNTDEIQCSFYHQSYCNVYVNVPKECPHMCGLCAK